MRKLLFILLIFIFSSNLYSQDSSKTIVNSFVNVNLGFEFKESNNKQLTMKITKVVPLLKLTMGYGLRKNRFLSVSLSNSAINLENRNDKLTYKKTGLSLAFGVSTKRNNLIFRNQIGYQINDYSIINLSKNNNPSDSFKFKANTFSSRSDDFYILYGFDLYLKKHRMLNYLGGLNLAYAVRKDPLLTNNLKERIVFQIYFGFSFSI